MTSPHSSDQVFEVAQCPGRCGSKVRIWPEGVNMCCLNCWRWLWEYANNGEVPTDADGQEIPEHSGQCEDRQAVRRDWVVTEGVFEIVGPPAHQIPLLKSGVAR